MKHTLRLFAATLALVVCATAARAQETADVQTTAAYTNQRGSTLYIENAVQPSGMFTGYYINRASGTGCQNTPFPVVGWVIGNAISFTVRWANSSINCSSVTGWTGNISRDGATITTSWYLAVNGSTSLMNGQDVFRRVARTTHRSMMEQ
jgi:hypothetical protein